MDAPLFRKSSMDRVSSPEQLNDYIRVASPGVWMVLAAVIVLLAGACVWGASSRLETVVGAAAVVKNGSAVCYVPAEEAGVLQPGMPLRIGEVEATLTAVDTQPVEVTGSFDAYAMYLGGLQAGDWALAVEAQVPVEDGTYAAEIVVDSVSPLSFLLN